MEKPALIHQQHHGPLMVSVCSNFIHLTKIKHHQTKYFISQSV